MSKPSPRDSLPLVLVDVYDTTLIILDDYHNVGHSTAYDRVYLEAASVLIQLVRLAEERRKGLL